MDKVQKVLSEYEEKIEEEVSKFYSDHLSEEKVPSYNIRFEEKIHDHAKYHIDENGKEEVNLYVNPFYDGGNPEKKYADRLDQLVEEKNYEEEFKETQESYNKIVGENLPEKLVPAEGTNSSGISFSDSLKSSDSNKKYGYALAKMAKEIYQEKGTMEDFESPLDTVLGEIVDQYISENMKLLNSKAIHETTHHLFEKEYSAEERRKEMMHNSNMMDVVKKGISKYTEEEIIDADKVPYMEPKKKEKLGKELFNAANTEVRKELGKEESEKYDKIIRLAGINEVAARAAQKRYKDRGLNLKAELYGGNKGRFMVYVRNQVDFNRIDIGKLEEKILEKGFDAVTSKDEKKLLEEFGKE